MIIAYVGERGSGKTLSMVAQSYKDKKKYKKRILANMEELKFKDFFLDKNILLDFANKNSMLSNCVLVIDEIHNLVDSRRSTAKGNLIFSYLVLQSRKRDVDIYYTTQDIGQVDKRLRQQTDLIISCESYEIINKEGLKLVFIQQFIESRKNLTKRVIFGNPIFRLYDTNEIIAPTT